MHAHIWCSKRSAQTILSCLILVCMVGVVPAWADDHGRQSAGARAGEPMPLSYPLAAPGSLHLYHWTDHTQQAMEPGSAAEARLEQRRMVTERRRQQGETIANDSQMREPLSLTYPLAAPGSLHLYHWTDYMKTDLAPDSVAEAHERGQQAEQSMYYRRMTTAEEAEMREPQPLAYSHAAPGSLHLYHWTDAAKTDLAPGSIAEARISLREPPVRPGGETATAGDGGDGGENRNFANVPLDIVKADGRPVTDFGNLNVCYIPEYFYKDLSNSGVARGLFTAVPVTTARLTISLTEDGDYDVWVSNSSDPANSKPISNVWTRRAYEAGRITLRLLH